MPQKRSKKKWLRFIPYTKGDKLEKVRVENRKTFHELGVIIYDNHWRQWVWLPRYGIQMSAGCLLELTDQMDKMNLKKGCYKQKEKRSCFNCRYGPRCIFDNPEKPKRCSDKSWSEWKPK